VATRPVVRVGQKLPTNQRDWEEFLRDLNSVIRLNGDQAVLSALTTISERTGTDLATLASYLTDEGRAEDQRFLPMVSAGNVLSLQNVGPVTQQSTAVTAQIDIAAHTVAYGFGTLTYNAGSITGLAPNTNYYVYADDQDYEGGAVTYLATANPLTVTGDNGRYFVGAIRTTPAATTLNVIAATAANPVELTLSDDHGWTSGNEVDFDGLPGDFGTALNSGLFIITVTAADKISVAVNGSGFAAYTSGGTATRTGTASTIGGNGGGGGWVNDSFSEFYPVYDY
jgi:hypothetical protein